MKEDETGDEGFLPGRCPMGKLRSKESKKDNKMAILCNLQAKEGPNIGYRRECISTGKTMGTTLGIPSQEYFENR